MILVAPSSDTTGLAGNTPASDRYSPTQLAVLGVPMLATVKKKNIAEKIGMYTVSPR